MADQQDDWEVIEQITDDLEEALGIPREMARRMAGAFTDYFRTLSDFDIVNMTCSPEEAAEYPLRELK